MDNTSPNVSVTPITLKYGSDGIGYTNSNKATITIEGTDSGSGLASQMRIASDLAPYGNWITLSKVATVDVSSGDGTKNVSVQLIDNAGNFLEKTISFVSDATSPDASFSGQAA